MTGPEILAESDLRQRLDALPGWTGDPSAINRDYEFPSFLAGIDAISAVARVAEEMDHHPDIDVRWRTVRFVCSTHSVGGVTELDLRLAEQIHRIATSGGA